MKCNFCSSEIKTEIVEQKFVEMPEEKRVDTNDKIREYLNVDKLEYINKEYKEDLKDAGIYTNYIENSQTH
jgi:hypothetical protein